MQINNEQLRQKWLIYVWITILRTHIVTVLLLLHNLEIIDFFIYVLFALYTSSKFYFRKCV